MPDSPARRLLHGLLSLAAFAVAVRPALAQGPERDNAATWYQRAIDAASSLSDDDRNLVITYLEDPAVPPSPEVRAAIQRASSALAYLRRGSEQGYHDLNLDYNQGFELMLPHLGPLRSLGRFAQAEALMLIHDGDALTAADHLAALYRTSGHIVSDRVLISTLVSQAIFKGTDNVLQQALDRAVIGPAESAELLRAIQQIATDDPFGYVESLMMEQTVAVEWLDKLFGSPADRLAAQGGLSGLFTNSEEAGAALAVMSDEQFQGDLTQYDALMNDIVEAYLMDDKDAAKARLTELEAGVEAGDFGVIATIMIPSFSRVYDRKLEAERMLDERIELLSGILTGDVKPEEQANAAVYYLRAIERLADAWPAEALEALRTRDLQPGRGLDAGLDSKLESDGEIIDLLRQGSQMHRCEFTRYRQRGLDALAPEYAAGLRDVLRLLRADAARARDAGRIDDFVDRAVIVCRMAAHLSADEPLASPLIIHRAFSGVWPLVAQSLDQGSLSDIHKLQLFDALDAMPLRDPFGYIGSVMAARKAMYAALIRASALWGEPQIAMLAAASERWTGDDLFYYAAIFDTMKRAGAADADNQARDAELAALADVFSLPALDRARDDAAWLAPMIGQGDASFLTGRPVITFANSVASQRQARADLRAALARLRPASAPREEAEERP